MKLKFKLLFLILFVGIFIPSCFPDDKKYIEPCTNDCGYGTCIDNETNDNKLKCDCPTFLSKYEINDTQYCASIIKKIFLSDNYDIDNKGNISIKMEYQEAKNFSEGLAAIKIGDKWGYINKKGDYEIKPKYGKAYDFKNEIARVAVNNKYGYINKHNNSDVYYHLRKI